ncbi:MAG: aminotransferase class IV [Sedimentibacter sp.]|uniref:aminotransferase class IV n=1 Tax=Sedimentibacter sp. TaxID=1960295 RepID=UPI0031589E80
MINIVSENNVANGKIVSKKQLQELIQKENAIYEVIRVVEGRPVFLFEHFCRMNKSIELSRLGRALDFEKFGESVKLLIDSNELRNCNIRVSYSHSEEDTVLFYFVESHYPSSGQFRDGVKTVTVKMHRDNPNVKLFVKNFKEEVQKVIDSTKSFEAILINDDDTVSEGSKSNIFFVREDTLVTSPDSDVLLGVTRDKVVDVCEKSGIKVEKRTVLKDELEQFDAAFITGTSNDVLPIRYIDEKEYTSAENPLVKKVSRLYLEEMKRDIS